MPVPTQYIVQNWLITPAARVQPQAPAGGEGDTHGPLGGGGATDEVLAASAAAQQQQWLLMLSGVALVDFKATAASGWQRQKLQVEPFSASAAALAFAIQTHGIRRPQGANVAPRFQVQQFVPYGALGAISHPGGLANVGHAVDNWRMLPFLGGTDLETGKPVSQLFNGLEFDLAVRDKNATLHRLSYHLTMIGRIVFLNVPPFS